MLPALPARPLMRRLPVLPVALVFLYGCSDAPLPVEPRALPTRPHALVGPTITVTNTDDDGAGSLREAITNAPSGATIQFDAGIAGQTIVLSTGQLTIDKLLTIEGPVPRGITISGGLNSRIFRVPTTGNAVLRNLSVINGRDKFAGGLEVEGTATLDHSLVANNEAAEVGAGGIFVRDGGDLTLVNSTISGNVSRLTGGGIHSSGTVLIRNSTIAFNTSAAGGGVFVSDGSFSLRNSIIAHNADYDGLPPDNPNCLFAPAVVPVLTGRNLSNDFDCGEASPALRLANAGLLPLAANGGPTRTHAHVFGFAVDAGKDCTEATDQRYVSRNQGPTCDLGAFEFTNYGTIALTVNPNAGVNTKTGVMTVTGTVRCSAAALLEVGVGASQTQKTTGKFTTIVQATSTSPIVVCGTGPTSWSAALAPQAGKFTSGSATSTATTTGHSGEFPVANVTAPLKAFQVK